MKVKEHMKELRDELFKIVIPFVIIFIIAFYSSDKIIFFLLNFYNIPIDSIVSITPFEGLQTRLNIASSISVLFLLPLILNGIIRYCKELIDDDIYNKSKNMVVNSHFIAIIGAMFGTLVFSKMILFNLITDYTITSAQWSIVSVFNFIIISSITFAIAMQIILLIPILIKIGLINKDLLKKIRPIIIISSMIISALLTPPDLLSMFIMSLVLYGAYEMGILLSKNKLKEVKK